MQIKTADIKNIRYDLSFNKTRPSRPSGEPSLFPLGGTLGNENEKRPRIIDAPAAM